MKKYRIIIDKSKNVWCIIPIKKISMVRLKVTPGKRQKYTQLQYIYYSAFFYWIFMSYGKKKVAEDLM